MCMIVNKNRFLRMLRCSSNLLLECVGYLTELDSKFGDGDHGVTIEKIAKLILSHIDGYSGETLYDFVAALSKGIMGIGGGAAGPLWGTLFEGFAMPLKDKEEIEPETLKAMFASALEELQSISNAKVGDKTMMDTLIPAVEAAQSAPLDPKEILSQAALAGENGCKATEGYAAKFGRAKNYKEKTIGTPDAGAVSLSLLLRGFANGV